MNTLAACAIALLSLPAPGDDPHADAWLAYDPGLNPAPGYTDPATTLGPPERFTGEGVFPSVVSVFNPPFGLDEIVSIGVDGHLVVRFDTPVSDDPGNPFGIDLLVFGNAFFLDASFPEGIVGGGLFADNGGVIEVSADGETWIVIEGVRADGLFPTIGWLDAGPYDTTPGTEPADFTRPVDPALLVGDFEGLGYDEVLALYAGSGGGAGVDLAPTGLAEISFVRITNTGDPATGPNIEIDAFSDVAADAGPADLDGDGIVGITDFLILLAAWGPCPGEPDPCPADLDGDGVVGIVDLLLLLEAWTT